MKLRDGREVMTHEPMPGVRYNVYDCPEGHALLSAEMDDGVTPAFSACPIHVTDDVVAVSRWYRVAVPPPPDLFPLAMVWRQATRSEIKRERREGGDHFARGGLAREWVKP